MSVKITIEDYKKKYGIKSLKTVYNHINKGVVKKHEDENGNIFVIENVKKEDCNINYNLQLQLQNEVRNLQFQLDNKEKFINHLQEQTKQQYNQIQSLNYQLLELSKNNTLLLENKKDKKWYQIWK